jgi:hypothetical protein
MYHTPSILNCLMFDFSISILTLRIIQNLKNMKKLKYILKIHYVTKLNYI